MLKRSSIISVSPEIMGGTPVFACTMVPVKTLLDYLKAGESIDESFGKIATSRSTQSLVR
jgi:uncharacterized protein (DUF433 family)